LNEVKRRNLPKIKEIQRKRKEIYEEIERLKGEFNELNSIKPIVRAFIKFLNIILYII
jgi:uncharacterized coiled-coil DUF342 family protein